MAQEKFLYGKISRKGWVVIPVSLRKRLNIKPGSTVLFEEQEGKLQIRPVASDPVEALSGMFKGGASLTEDLLRERREEIKREEKKIERLGSG
jgi:AbrB family looped-hinge helix DNA binding protein